MATLITLMILAIIVCAVALIGSAVGGLGFADKMRSPTKADRFRRYVGEYLIGRFGTESVRKGIRAGCWGWIVRWPSLDTKGVSAYYRAFGIWWHVPLWTSRHGFEALVTMKNLQDVVVGDD